MQRPPMKNASRERRKAERAALAAQAQALELELAHRRHAAIGAAVSPTPLDWRARAHDEIRKRRLAECTNHQLHEALRRQEKTLAALVRSLNVTPEDDDQEQDGEQEQKQDEEREQEYDEQEEHEQEGARIRPWPKKLCVVTDDACGDGKGSGGRSPVGVLPARQLHDAHGRRFAMLLEDVEHAYAQDLDVVFSPDSDRGGDAFAPALVRHRKSQELVLEARRATAFACDLARCCGAFWAASEQVATATHHDAWVTRPSPDVVFMRLRASARHDGTAWVATSSLVQKRFWDGARMAIVWRAVTSIDNQPALADVYIEETGWTLIAEADDDGVVLSDCLHTVPRSTRLEGDAVDDDDAVDALVGEYVKQFTRHVMQATTAHMDAIRDRMENLLIDDCMQVVEP